MTERDTITATHQAEPAEDQSEDSTTTEDGAKLTETRRSRRFTWE